MTHPLNPVRRNSFRHITESQYFDLTLGRVRNVSRERRNGADHITTEFQNGTLILSDEEMAVLLPLLARLVKLDTHQRMQVLGAVRAQTQPADDASDEYDYQLRNMQ